MAHLAIKGGAPSKGAPFPLWPTFDERELKAVEEVVKSRAWWQGSGSKTKEFAKRFAEYHQAQFGVAVTNGTHALEIALAALGVGPGDEVIIPDYTFIATATAVLYANAIPVLVDIDPHTYCIDPEEVETAITERTKVIIPVHMGGHTADMDSLLKIAQKYGIKVIEDSAHAHSAEWKGRKVGALGEMGTFSFQASKLITAGEGGVIITNDETLAERAYSFSDCGRLPGEWFYAHFNLGSNYRMTEWQGAVLLVQLERLEEQSRRRNENGAYLTCLLEEIEGIAPQKRDPRCTNHGYYAYIFHYDQHSFGEVSRDRFGAALHAEGIPTQASYPAIHETALFQTMNFRPYGCPLSCPYYLGKKHADYKGREYPATKRAAEETIWLPQYMFLGERRDMEEIAEAIVKIQKYVDELL